MSKVDNTSAFTIVKVEKEVKPNKYAGAVAALIDAGEGQGLSLTVPKGKTREGGSAEGRPDRILFQTAARDAGYSARVKSASEDGDNITFTFVLGPKQNRRTAEEIAAEGSEQDVESDTLDDVEATD